MLDTKDKFPIIASMSATGATTREIGEAIDLSHMQVSRLLKKQEIKEIIKQCESAIAHKGYIKSTDNILKVIHKFDPDIPIDKDDKHSLAVQEMGFRASMKLAESIGLTPSNSMAPMINQINVQGTANIINPLVDRALTQAMLVPDTTICSAEDD